MRRTPRPHPKRLAALTGLALIVGAAVLPAHADSTTHETTDVLPRSTGAIGHGATPGGQVTRDQIMARAEDWVAKQVPYTHEGVHGQKYDFWQDDPTGGPYRQDCSGFISMAWQLDRSRSTDDLSDVAEKTTWEQLQPGDALNTTSGGHAILFAGWTDKAKGVFRYIAQSRRGVPTMAASANRNDQKIAGHDASGYQPLRYRKISETPPAPAPAPQPPAPTPAPAPAHEAASSPAPAATPSAPSTSAPAQSPAPSTPAPVPAPAPAPADSGTSVAATGSRLYRIAPDHTAVEEYTGKGDTWVKVRGATRAIYTSRSTLYATDRTTGDIWQYDPARKNTGGEPHQAGVDGPWIRIGGPGAQFAATADRLYGVSPDHSGIYEYTGTPGVWNRVRLAGTDRILTSAGTLYAVDTAATAVGGDIHQYDAASGRWTRIGGPGAQFAATADHVFGVSPDHTGLYEYTGTPGVWDRVRSTGTDRIYTSHSTLYATDPVTPATPGDIRQYDREHRTWTRIGGPGANFLATDTHLYGVSPDHTAIYQYTGRGDDWTKISGPIAA
ncbi:hypothetical protein ACIG0C_36460 [Kitasatospora aureofaciens]|uniref:NlpC/P60 domain-containing protein n=1 Tax=Kitasatospora aureofaciens TaxID=1894 RepID=A0A1E7NEM5_KITAU|nr:hypothetical protein [Kitasatospora aureofaciens]ARF83349.1 hypothetical protein B6264_31005 [Kitasatospora aureofaciens]OEV39122.1 hypothetical protein HS99_0018735 [Kitasatospora aureofaciens]GGV08542.1 hypothetical protein GCM10010502_74260 [Kitasatospora aureofaciens]